MTNACIELSVLKHQRAKINSECEVIEIDIPKIKHKRGKVKTK